MTHNYTKLVNANLNSYLGNSSIWNNNDCGGFFYDAN